jgi:hypothetical protein
MSDETVRLLTGAEVPADAIAIAGIRFLAEDLMGVRAVIV